MAERDPISELSAAQQKYSSEAEGHFKNLDDDLRSTWRSVTGTMHMMNITANGDASRLEKMRDDPTTLGPDPHRTMHLAAEEAAATVERHRATTRTRLDIYTNLLRAAARPSVPADPQRQNLLRDDLRTKLSGLAPDQQVNAMRTVASGENRELAGLLDSEWGKDFRRSQGHGGKEIDTVISEETIRGSATHGVGREKVAALALRDGVPAAEKALLAAHLGAKSTIDAVRPGQPLIASSKGGL
jgi:hypothetical protein